MITVADMLKINASVIKQFPRRLQCMANNHKQWASRAEYIDILWAKDGAWGPQTTSVLVERRFQP